MKVVKVSTGADGRSSLRNIPLAALQKIRINPLPMGEVLIRRTFPEDNVKFHNPSSAMWVVTLAGSACITCGDGSSEVMVAGDVLWAEDVDGEGHMTEELSDERLTLVCRIQDGGVWPDGLDA